MVESKISETPRLIIEKMVLKNFKSYEGVLEIGPFHKRFSSIVGPNGSGKSNIIDALLFVFGRRSSEIRFKKITDLVFRSPDNISSESCSVTVHFASIIDRDNQEDNEEKYEVVEKGRFSVGREVTEKGVSKYRINQNHCSFKDLSDLLMKHQIDLHNNRFLILQGEVESISQMKPMATKEGEKGLLEYLEEIIGSNKFVSKIEGALSRLENLTEAREETLSRMKLVEREKQSLEGSHSVAIAFLTRDWELQKKNVTLQQIYLFYLQKGYDCLCANERKLREQEVKEKQALESVTEKFEELTKKFSDKKFAIHDIDTKCQQLMKKFNLLEEEDASINVNITFEQKKGKKIKASLKEEGSKLSHSEQEINFYRVELPKMEKQIEELEEQKKLSSERLNAIVSELKEKTPDVRKKLQEKESELEPFENRINVAKQTMDGLNEKIETIKQSVEKEETTRDNLRKDIDSLQNKIEEKKKKIKTAKEPIERIKQSVGSARNNLSKISTELKKVSPQLENARSKYETVLETVEKSKRTEGIYGELIRQKNNGNIPGIFGRLGSLGSIDLKYDIAVSTASGLLKSVLVDNAETGAKCIQFLKERKLGRASFMMLDKQRHFEQLCNRPLETPENAPRLFDLIRAKEERFRPAFYSALKNTLFAEQIETAVRISNYGGRRWRVVTAKGELVDQSGTISGGGRTPQRGLMAQKSTAVWEDVGEDQVEELRLEVERQSQRKLKLQNAEKSLAEKIEVLEREKMEQLMAERILKDETDNEMQTFLEISKQLPGQEKKASLIKSQTEREMQRLKRDFSEAKKRYEKAKKNASSLRTEIKELENEIVSKGGQRLIEAKEENRKIEKTIALAKKKLAEVKVTVSTSERNLEELKKKIGGLEKQFAEVKTRLSSLKSKSKGIEERGRDICKEHKQLKEKRKEEEGRFEAETKELKEAEEKSKALRRSLVDIGEQLRDFVTNKTANMAKINAKKKERDAFFARLKRSEVLLNEDALSETPCDSGEEGEKRFSFELLPDDQLPEGDKEQLVGEIQALERELKKMNPNMSAIEEYQAKLSEYKRRIQSLEEATAKAEEAKDRYDGYRKQRLEDFKAGFSVITQKLKEMYQLLTMGGDAELECVDRFDPFAEGVEFSVRPPKKSWKNISNLSGGEKTLSSLALVFALHYYKPTPLYVMDEIDAALDFKNVAVVAQYVRRRTRNAQFMIISLRHSMFEAAHRLVGVYKPRASSKCLTVDPNALNFV